MDLLILKKSLPPFMFSFIFRHLPSITTTAVLIFCVLDLSNSSSIHSSVTHEIPKVLLVSFDGFRWDYLNNRTKTPNFNYIKQNGVHATRGLVNAFITKTLPNHYAIVTGLYEESHGMVGNEFYDPKLKEVFEFSNKTQAMESKWFDNGGEPIWVSNQKGSYRRRSGIVFWPGDSASVKGYLPTTYLPWNPLTPNETRIDYIITWFTTKQPINLGLLYFEEPDGYGHLHGPDSDQMTNMIGALDSVLGYLISELRRVGLLDKINLIVTSDHGMAQTPSDKIIDLDKYINNKSYKIFSSNPVANILPNPGISVDDIIKNLTTVPHIKVYKKSDIPERYHYKHNPRIQPILIVPDEGYSLRHNGSYVGNGNHGYDNQLPDMHPVFVAMGPSFKKGYSKDTFHNVDIYPLLCHILGVDPAPNNGSLQSVIDLLVGEDSGNHDQGPTSTFLIYIVILSIIICVAGIFCLGACLQRRFHKRNIIRMLAIYEQTSQSQHGSMAHNGKIPLLGSDSEDEF